MRRLGIGSAVLAVTFAAANAPVYGRDASGQYGSPKTPAQRADSAQSDKTGTSGFINDMAAGGMAEVQLGKMAAEKAMNPDVKSFGQMMVKQHSEANEELKQVASQLKVQLPTQLDPKHKALADRLSKLSGPEFDREYMKAMAQEHKQVAGQLRTRAGHKLTSSKPAGSGGTTGAPGTQPSGSKPPTTGSETVGTTGSAQGEQALTQWAAKTLPKVEDHLKRAQEIQQKMGK